MSRFFDLLQRLNQRTDDSFAHANVLGFENKEAKASDLDHALSVLLSEEPAGRKTTDDGLGSHEMSQPTTSLDEEIEVDSALERIPVEEVHVRPEDRIVLETAPHSAGADRFRLLRMRLRELWKTKNLRTLLVTSTLPQEGKSTVALNLATVLAEGGKRPVLLVEADLHRSPLIHQLGLGVGPGLAECLEDGVNPMTTLRHLKPLGWYLLPAGKAQGNSTELLQGDIVSRTMQKISPYFDWVLIDSPPITPLSDALSLSRHANASILVVRAGRTPKEDVERAIGLLGKQNLLGILLNGLEGLDGLYSRYSTYYGNGNGRGNTAATK